jgi:hypothetical protein
MEKRIFWPRTFLGESFCYVSTDYKSAFNYEVFDTLLNIYNNKFGLLILPFFQIFLMPNTRNGYKNGKLFLQMCLLRSALGIHSRSEGSFLSKNVEAVSIEKRESSSLF